MGPKFQSELISKTVSSHITEPVYTLAKVET